MPAKVAPAKAPAPSKKVTLPKKLANIASHKRSSLLFAKLKAKAAAQNVPITDVFKPAPKNKTKPIGGPKNGGTRLVLKGKNKGKAYYPTEDVPTRRRGRKPRAAHHPRSFKAGLEPGRVVIILAGRHKGKRVVVLKQLQSGLLLVTGPYCLNRCPVRRMHQNYTIVTSTKLDLSTTKVPEKLNDAYFKRSKDESQRKKKLADGDIFESKKVDYRPSEERKATQKEVDKLILNAIYKNKVDKHMLLGYLGAYFQLKKGVYPHLLKF